MTCLPEHCPSCTSHNFRLAHVWFASAATCRDSLATQTHFFAISRVSTKDPSRARCPAKLSHSHAASRLRDETRSPGRHWCFSRWRLYITWSWCYCQSSVRSRSVCRLKHASRDQLSMGKAPACRFSPCDRGWQTYVLVSACSTDCLSLDSGITAIGLRGCSIGRAGPAKAAHVSIRAHAVLAPKP